MARTPKPSKAASPKKSSPGRAGVVKPAGAIAPGGPKRPRLGARPSPSRRQTVSLELTGKWLAWSADRMTILGHGDSPEEAEAAAGQGDDLVIAFVPPASQLRSRPGPPAPPTA